MAAQDPSFSEMAQKAEDELHDLEEEDKALAAFEAELQAAEERVEAAEARYNVATRKVATELAKPMYEEAKSGKALVQEEKPFAHDDTADSAEKNATEKHQKGTKNASAQSDKAMSYQRGVAKRAQEKRIRDATKRNRDRFIKNQRDKRGFDFEAGEAGVGTDTQAAPTAAAPAAKEAAKPRELVSADTPAAKEGALAIADRLSKIKESGDAAEKRRALAKAVTGGRDNYYTFDPSDVVADLRERNLIDAATASELTAIIEAAAPAKGKRLPPSEWLAHAQKVSTVANVEQKPFTESELTYLKSVEDKTLVAAEKELAAAEAQLQLLVLRAEAMKLLEDEEGGADRHVASAELEVDQDYAAQLEEQHERHRESHGTKNTSAMSDKEIGCKKWEANRDKESREREEQKKATDTKRGDARDRKMDAANAAQDA